MSIEIFELQKEVEYVKIHSLQRSGSNYLTYLIDQNFQNTKTLVNLGGWKHGHYMVPWAIGKEVHTIIVTKSPYSWLASVYEYWGKNRSKNIGPDLSGISFEDFVTNRLILEKQHSVPYLFRAENPVQHWNNMHYHWTSIRLNEKKLIVVNYETLINDAENVMQRVAKSLNLSTNDNIITSEFTFQPTEEQVKVKEEKFNREYYMENQFMKYFNQKTLDFVNEQLDTEIMLRLGYPYIGEL